MDHLRQRLERLEQRLHAVERQLRWQRGLAGALIARVLRSRRDGSRDQMIRHTPGRRGILAVGMVVGWITSAAGHTINCGDTLGPGGMFQLQADLDCGDVSPALTVRDGARLDLGGYTIRTIGLVILLDGQGAVLQNGIIRGSEDGLSLEGGGWHTVRGVEVDTEGEGGISVRSDHNRLLSNTADSAIVGIGIGGRHNLLANNIGFGQLAFAVGGDTNLLFHNITPSAIHDAFVIGGDDNLLVSNDATGGGDNGFIIRGNGNKLVGNVARGYSQGIEVSGQKNVIVRNSALHNQTDLIDAHEDCDGNLWHENVFQTSQAGSMAAPACIQ
jgi:hypothetical protein